MVPNLQQFFSNDVPSNKFFEESIRHEQQQAYTLSSENRRNFIISLSLISAFPPNDFNSAENWNIIVPNHVTKLHVKYSLLLGFYINTLLQLVSQTTISTQNAHADNYNANLQHLQLFITKQNGVLYTFTRAPMAHKKHSRVQYHFMHYKIHGSAAHALPRVLITNSISDALYQTQNWIRILQLFDTNVGVLQRLQLSLYFNSSTFLRV